MFKALSGMSNITSATNYTTFCKHLADNKVFQLIPDDNRYIIYIDYTSHLEKIEKVCLVFKMKRTVPAVNKR